MALPHRTPRLDISRVAFQGEPGAFSEEAVATLWPHAEPVPMRTVADVARAVSRGDADAGVLPVENTVAGGVVAAYDAGDRASRSRARPLAGLDSATIVALGGPVSATRDMLAAASGHLAGAALVMDVGSTKRSPIAAAESLGIGDRFVGTHPITGDHRSGWAAARFVDATVYLCSTRVTRAASLVLARHLWTALGARPELVDAGVHDARVAFTSHLPHTAAAAIALALSKAHLRCSDLGPGGRDALRIVASPEAMWAAIATDNAEPILRALAALESELAQFRAALATGDEASLHALFSAANAWMREDG